MKSKMKMALAVISLLAISLMVTSLAAVNVSASNDNDDGRGRGRHMEIRVRNLLNRVIKSQTNATVALTNLVGTAVSGSANIKASLKTNGLYDTSIKVRVNGAPGQSNQVFEGWLVDNDSGYKLSLGGFNINGSSARSSLEFRQMLVNFPIYDKIMVTEETVNDANPNPGIAVLSADMPASFNQFKLRAVLRGANQVPPVASTTATGLGSFIINTKDNTLSFEVSFQGLTSAETGAHIHGPAGLTENAGILFSLPLGSPKAGVWNYDQTLENDILAGRTYVNVHSTTFPSGEIRGQILPSR